MENDELQRRIAASEARIRDLLSLIARLDGRVHQLERHARSPFGAARPK